MNTLKIYKVKKHDMTKQENKEAGVGETVGAVLLVLLLVGAIIVGGLYLLEETNKKSGIEIETGITL